MLRTPGGCCDCSRRSACGCRRLPLARCPVTCEAGVGPGEAAAAAMTAAAAAATVAAHGCAAASPAGATATAASAGWLPCGPCRCRRRNCGKQAHHWPGSGSMRPSCGCLAPRGMGTQPAGGCRAGRGQAERGRWSTSLLVTGVHRHCSTATRHWHPRAPTHLPGPACRPPKVRPLPRYRCNRCCCCCCVPTADAGLCRTGCYCCCFAAQLGSGTQRCRFLVMPCCPQCGGAVARQHVA